MEGHPAWMPAWEHLPSESLTIHKAAPEAPNATDSGMYTTTTLDGGLATNFIGDSGVPVWIRGNASASANAASSTMLGGITGPRSGHLASLGMVTVMVMLYNLCAGLGLGVMLWKGVIDWKGNVNDRFTNATTNNNDNPVTVIVTDNAGNEWYVPLTWVESAVQRVSANTNGNGSEVGIANATVELTGTEGNTGQLRLETLVDEAVQTLRTRAAGLI